MIPKGKNPNTCRSVQKKPRHARENIPKVKDQGDEMSANLQVVTKASKPRGKLMRQKASARSNPDRYARSNKPRCAKPSTRKDLAKEKPRHCIFEIGECSRTKDDSGRVIEEEESEVEETEGLEIVSERETLRKMKRKPKGKEKSYRDRMY